MTTATDRPPFEDIARSVRERLNAQFEQNATLAREQFDKASARLTESIDAWSVQAKADAEAFAVSSVTLAKGLQDIGKETEAYARALLELSHDAGKRFLAAGTLGEALEAQQAAARSGYDAFVSESGKLRDLTLKIAEEAAAPFASRIGAWSDTFTKAR